MRGHRGGRAVSGSRGGLLDGGAAGPPGSALAKASHTMPSTTRATAPRGGAAQPDPRALRTGRFACSVSRGSGGEPRAASAGAGRGRATATAKRTSPGAAGPRRARPSREADHNRKGGQRRRQASAGRATQGAAPPATLAIETRSRGAGPPAIVTRYRAPWARGSSSASADSRRIGRRGTSAGRGLGAMLGGTFAACTLPF